MLKSMSTRRLLLAAGLALLGWTFAPAVQASADPTAFIQEVSSKAITEVAPAASETDKQRAAKLKPLLEQYFDMPAIAKYMLGSYWPKATPEEHPLLDQLVGYAIRYFHDFVKPAKRYRAPSEKERAALTDLDQRLANLPKGVLAEEIQAEVYAVGKEHGFEPLRDWFAALYEVLLGQIQGPRFGSFVELYGIDETRALIARALAGELVAS